MDQQQADVIHAPLLGAYLNEICASLSKIAPTPANIDLLSSEGSACHNPNQVLVLTGL